MTPQEGEILAGKYRVEKVLGVGGMGVVVAATHLQLDERVALKFLLPETAQNGEAVARFAREARAAVKIKSEHVARVSDVGTLETGAPYMVMEYLTGSDLSERLRAQGPLPITEAVELLLQACAALAEAHGLGIVHRDLKPGNLFLTRRANGSPCIKILDFGISKMGGSGASDLGMTSTSTVMGSPLYMSPEQMTSAKDVDLRTDIWAMGVILYELVSGRVPFEAESLGQLCGMILTQPPRPLLELRPDVPPGLLQVIERCLVKDRTHRFGSVSELGAALLPFAPHDAARSYERIAGVESRPSGAVSQTQLVPSNPLVASGVAASTNAAWGQTAAGKKRSSTVLVAGALGVLVLAAAAGGWSLLQRAPSAETVAASSEVTAPSVAPASAAAPAPPPAAAPSPSSTVSPQVPETAAPTPSAEPVASAAPI
ncbi:MAG TPA: serine/threonine-protein kinase, partial [Polyangiaceae bacterium]|nr:serine/threonine-protein kinase [Polyangiaceae bacterium]